MVQILGVLLLPLMSFEDTLGHKVAPTATKKVVRLFCLFVNSGIRPSATFSYGRTQPRPSPLLLVPLLPQRTSAGSFRILPRLISTCEKQSTQLPRGLLLFSPRLFQTSSPTAGTHTSVAQPACNTMEVVLHPRSPTLDWIRWLGKSVEVCGRRFGLFVENRHQLIGKHFSCVACRGCVDVERHSGSFFVGFGFALRFSTSRSMKMRDSSIA